MSESEDTQSGGLIKRAVALKAIIAYLINARAGNVTEAVISEKFDEKIFYKQQSKGVVKEYLSTDYAEYKRLGASSETYERTFLSVLTVINELIDKKKISIPEEYRKLAALAGLNTGGDAPLPIKKRRGLLEYLDGEKLKRLNQNHEEIEAVLKAYEGCWRTYRLSSSSVAGQEDVSVGLLNIKPFRFLKADGPIIPQFSFRQISRDAAERGEGRRISTLHGVINKFGDRITLLGIRDSIPTSSWPLTGILTLFNPHMDDEVHETLMEGVLALPNSEGTQIISGYYVAEFIDESDKLDEAGYVKLKAAESKKFGSKKWAKAQEEVSRESTKNAIAEMISRSSKHVVFVNPLTLQRDG